MISIDEINKEGDFQVPEGYFEQFSAACFAKIREADRHRHHRRRLISTISSIAASIVVVIATTIGLTLMTQENNPTTTFASGKSTPTAVDTTEINNLLAKNDTHYEMTNEMEAAIAKPTPAPVYNSRQEMASIVKRFDEGDYIIMEFYADEIEFESTF